jgi:hypothetical protein
MTVGWDGNVTATSFTGEDITTTGDLSVGGGASFTQSPTAPTPSAGDNSTKLATTEFVSGAIIESLSNSKVTIAGNDVSLGGSITADTLRTSLGLSNAIHFKGTTTTTMSDGLATANITINGSSYTPSAGDVVLYDDSEFIWTGSAWERLGRDSSFKLTQTAITDSTGTAESTTATRFIYSIS